MKGRVGTVFGPLCMAALGLLIGAMPATAQIMGDLPTIRHVSVGKSFGSDSQETPFALLGVDKSGAWQLIVRTMNRKTGMQKGSDLMVAIPGGVTPVEVLFSRVFKPGSVLVLDAQSNVRQYELMFLDDGTPVLSDTKLLGPFDATGLESCVNMAEAPNFSDPTNPFLAIGTASGALIFTDGVVITKDDDLVGLPILDLAVVPQVGYFAVVALVPNKSTGGRLVGINPDGDPSPGMQPVVNFDLLAEPRPDPFQFIAGAVFEPNDEPLVEPSDVYLVAGTGGDGVFRLGIPADSATATNFVSSIITEVGFPIAQLAVGSLALVPADGSGVLFDPGFQVSQGGVSGTLLTVFGSAVDLSPDALKLSSNGQWVTAVIEVAKGIANEIDVSQIVLEFNGGSLGPSPLSTPQLGDFDGDGIADLKVRFDRSRVQAMLSGQSGPVVVTLRWKFFDGSEGFASAQIKCIP